MTAAELLKPRYKVIADYPRGAYKKGDIIYTLDDYPEAKLLEGLYSSLNPSEYPHLFQKLEWWEEREEKDMPKRVRDDSGIVWDIEDYHHDDIYDPILKTKHFDIFLYLDDKTYYPVD